MQWVDSRSPAETERIGMELGRLLERGDVLAISGGLGAGKTCFVKGLARGLGVPRSVRIASPTFTLVNEHHGRLRLFHADLYRIERAEELEEIGLREYLEGDGVTAVEWFDRFPDSMPDDRIEVRLEAVGATQRRIHITAIGVELAARLHEWPDGR